MKGKILVIDDSLTSLELLSNILSKQGYSIYTANSGPVALTSVIVDVPDLILLDVRMEAMDGFEVCDKLKSMEGIKDIPVIFLSGLTSTNDKVRGFELGAVDFISIPFQHDELLARVKTHILMRQMQVELKRQAAELIDNNLQLEASEEKFRNIVESTPMGMYLYELLPDGKLIFNGANPSADKIIGTDHHKFIGKTIQEAFPNLANTNVPEMYSDIAAGKIGNQQFEIEYHDEQPINGFYNVSVFQSGKNFVTVQFIDISEQKNADLALKASEERFRHVFEHSPISMSMTRSDGTLRVNRAFCEMIGYTEEELQGKSWKEITHPDDIQESIDVIYRLNCCKKGIEFEKRYIHKNGSVVYGNVYSVVQCDSEDIPMFYITTVVNITRRKLAEEKLRRSENELKKAQQITHIGSWYLDMDSNEVVWTEELYKMYGFDPTLPPPPYSEHRKLFTPESWELLSTSLTHTSETGIPYELELKTVKQDGGNGWMWVRGESIKDAKGKTIGLWGAAQDISIRKISEEQLLLAKLEIEESEIRYHTLVSNTPLVTFVLDSNGIFTLSDGKGLDKLGLKPGQIVGLSAVDVYKDFPSVVHDIKEALAGKHIRTESILPGVVFDVSYTPIFDNQGHVIEVIGVANDITELKKSNEAIIKLSKAIEQSPLSIVITNIQGDIEYTNPKFTEITGYSRSEAKGKNPRILKSGETSVDEYNALWKAISTGNEWHGEFHNRKKNGDLYWESASISPIVNEKDEIINYIAIKEDISIQKVLLEELVVSKEKAEESDRLKSAFLANMSHEIRTPLNGILGFTELLIDPDFDEKQKKDMARLILDNGDQLLAIINDVLDISKIESGQIEMRNTIFSVNQLIRDVWKSFEQRAQVNKIELRIANDFPTYDISITNDQIKTRQILNNLLSNALKYTDNGFIEIGFRATEKELTFHVKDSGVGVPAKFREKIFDRFRHLEPNRSKLAGGNGLGLSISRSFVEMMGGRIWVESTEGKGSCFYFTLPLQD